MRKLLLAGAAVIGSVGVASAQTTTTTTTTAMPMPMSAMGMPSQPAPYLGGNNAIDQDGGAMSSPSASAPAPGSMTIHLNGRVWGYFGFGGGSGYVYHAPGTSGAAAKLNPMQY